MAATFHSASRRDIREAVKKKLFSIAVYLIPSIRQTVESKVKSLYARALQ